MTGVLGYLALMSDQEVQSDVEDCVVPALADEYERAVARAYRRARIKTGKHRGGNNHARMPAGWADPQKVADLLETLIGADLAGLVKQLRVAVKMAEQGVTRPSCQQCGRAFTAARSTAKFCSARCRAAAARKG